MKYVARHVFLPSGRTYGCRRSLANGNCFWRGIRHRPQHPPRPSTTPAAPSPLPITTTHPSTTPPRHPDTSSPAPRPPSSLHLNSSSTTPPQPCARLYVEPRPVFCFHASPDCPAPCPNTQHPRRQRLTRFSVSRFTSRPANV